MIDMDLGKKFDVITCLFSSIGYVKTYSNLEQTARALFSWILKDCHTHIARGFGLK